MPVSSKRKEHRQKVAQYRQRVAAEKKRACRRGPKETDRKADQKDPGGAV